MYIVSAKLSFCSVLNGLKDPFLVHISNASSSSNSLSILSNFTVSILDAKRLSGTQPVFAVLRTHKSYNQFWPIDGCMGNCFCMQMGSVHILKPETFWGTMGKTISTNIIFNTAGRYVLYMKPICELVRKKRVDVKEEVRKFAKRVYIVLFDLKLCVYSTGGLRRPTTTYREACIDSPMIRNNVEHEINAHPVHQ